VHDFSEGKQVIQVPLNHRDDDFRVELAILVNGHIAKSHHTLQLAGKGGLDESFSLQYGEGVAAFGRHTKTLLTDHHIGQVNADFARPQRVEYGHILHVEVLTETTYGPGSRIPGPADATLQTGDLLDENIIHER